MTYIMINDRFAKIEPNTDSQAIINNHPQYSRDELLALRFKGHDKPPASIPQHLLQKTKNLPLKTRSVEIPKPIPAQNAEMSKSADAVLEQIPIFTIPKLVPKFDEVGIEKRYLAYIESKIQFPDFENDESKSAYLKKLYPVVFKEIAQENPGRFEKHIVPVIPTQPSIIDQPPPAPQACEAAVQSSTSSTTETIASPAIQNMPTTPLTLAQMQSAIEKTIEQANVLNLEIFYQTYFGREATDENTSDYPVLDQCILNIIYNSLSTNPDLKAADLVKNILSLIKQNNSLRFGGQNQLRQYHTYSTVIDDPKIGHLYRLIKLILTTPAFAD